MPFSKSEKGIEVNESGDIVAVKEDRHILPGDPEWGNHVPVSTAPEDSPETAALKQAAADDPGLDKLVVEDTITITDAEARQALETVAPGAPGTLERLSEEKQARAEADAANAQSQEPAGVADDSDATTEHGSSPQDETTDGPAQQY